MILWSVQIWIERRWVKLYGWKEDLRYWIMFPRFIIWGLLGIANKQHTLNEMSKMDYLHLAMSCCYASAGRLYRWEKVERWITIATGIRFDYYSSKACMEHILEKYPKIAKQVEGKSWDVEVEKWE